MTDKEIIKALECCKDSDNFQRCSECPYKEGSIGVSCLEKILADAFDLTKRQQAEIERLKDEKEKLLITYDRHEWAKHLSDVHKETEGET